MRFLLLIVSVLMMFNISVAFSLEGENPYKEGVERVKLTEAEKTGLLKFINSSKYLLEKALSDAKGKTLSEANRSYYKTILMVVMESYKNKRRGELLMRYALNQALELTYGIPTDDGKGIEKEGILKNVSNTDLLTVILEDSIKLAIDYYEKDKLAIEGLDLVNLPYIEFSQKKLLLSWNWLSSIFEYDVLLDFEIAVLEQWLLTVKNEETLETETVSPMIYEVVEALERVNTENHKIERKGEYLKGIIYKLKNQKMILNKNNIKNSGSGTFDLRVLGINLEVANMDELDFYNFYEAKEACEKKGMRVPTIIELGQMFCHANLPDVDKKSKSFPQSDPGCKNNKTSDTIKNLVDLGRYWSSKFDTNYAMLHHFSDGSQRWRSGHNNNRVRCVRSF